MNVLSISDITIPFIYSPQVRNVFGHVDFVISCGDLPYYYQEYIISMLDVPLFFVHGNHDFSVEHGAAGPREYPHGAIDLHRNVLYKNGLLIAGIEGSIRYSTQGQYQYSQSEMWFHVLNLVPKLMLNRLFRGRYLDIFVSHSPPWGIHDELDWTHQGIKAFRWLNKTFHPAYHFHGHIHVYRPDTITETKYNHTVVVNSFGYRETVLELST